MAMNLRNDATLYITAQRERDSEGKNVLYEKKGSVGIRPMDVLHGNTLRKSLP